MLNSKQKTLFIILPIILIVVFILALLVGRYNISISDFFKMIKCNNEYNIERSIVYNLRLPRTIIAMLVGASLSVSGILFQETFQNKLISPDLLGVSSGASVGAAISILIGLSALFVSIFAFIFGIITVFITVTISKVFNSKSSMTMPLAGIIISGLMGAILSFIKYLADAETTLASITFWLMGSFENAKIEDVYILMPVVIVCLSIIIIIRWKVNLIALGKEEAQTKGINYNFYKMLIIILATILTASSVAISGTVSWIGLVVPHIARITLGNNTKYTIPFSILFGAIFMILIDVLSRTFSSSEIPLSAVSGFFGTIIFIILLYIRRKSFNEYY